MRKSLFLSLISCFLMVETFAQEAPEEALPGFSAAQDSLAVQDTLKDQQKERVSLNPPVVQPLELIFPSYEEWNKLQEGQVLEFQLKALGGVDSIITFALTQGKTEEMVFDSLGGFSWTPGYDFVDRLEKERSIQLLFEARNGAEESVSQVVEFVVEHINRPPEIGELKPFYVQPNVANTYTIESSVIKDKDNDPVVFVPIIDGMPQGAKLSPQGEFSWQPSLTQFNRLRDTPILLEFYVEDQPSKARSKGHFMLKATQQDLPPSIQMIPSQKRFEYEEDATVNLKFQLYDPNGEDDIASFSFISENMDIPASALVRNTPFQYEFIWKPGYDFVKDPLDSISFRLTFFVIDHSNKKEERTVEINILNAINEEERDMKLYNEYRASLVKAWDLLEQLKEAEKDLKKKYKRAKRGKKARSLTNASLGAATGVAPVVVDVPGTSKKITAIGGTAVMTIGTLEATEVIGRSTKDLVERLNYIMEKRNELQTRGDIFARKYALKSSRRQSGFMKDVDDFVLTMNLKGLVALELDAGWKNKSRGTNENIAKTFKDFKPEDFKPVN